MSSKFSKTKPGNPNLNDQIRAKEVLLIDEEGQKHGVVKTKDALDMAYERGLDLIVVSPNQEPPVAKILDYGKYKFETEKRAKEARKKQHTVEIKEVKMRYKIDVHDYNVRIKSIKKFLEQGNKIKILIILRGREAQHSKLAFDLIKRVQDDLKDENFTIEKNPGLEGKNVSMIIAPSGS